MNASRLVAIVLALGAVLWVGSGLLAGDEPAETAETSASGMDENAAPIPTESPSAGHAPRAAVRVRTSEAVEHVDMLRISGRTEAVVSVEIRAQIDATVEQIGAVKGQRVKKGDLLVKLAVEDRLARVEKARALVAQRELENSAAKSLAEKNYRSKTGVAETKALLEEARADLKLAQIELTHTEIHAPFDGVVEDRPAEIGDLLSIGDPVATLIQADPMLVVAHVPEHSIGDIQNGQLAHITLFDGREADGVVRYVSRVSDNSTRTYRVEVEIENTDLSIPDGMTSELQIPIGTKMAHRVVPSVLTLNDEGQVGVRGIVDEDKVAFYPVQLQGGNRDGIWIGGLPEKIDLIVVGHDWVKEGATVDVSRLEADNGSEGTQDMAAAPKETVAR
ncbi:efflux RND transporter periplasmic adaptor subunit [Thalassospira lucentensis]|uniref:efflux RND transporter periplasmic adaptor subunit n=1 Tax=Thalassospira lucentensis TaxID=168935 RepID=UPI0029422354|nr:efflux RND transporter periplasmic adaptor subunit [Thalassospira lucentensis]WOI09416.1 efflux RND transporter periplasmic adaptor subunit [Thalassospira lucentensis]